MLLQGCGHRENQKRGNSGAIGFEDAQRAYPGNPHHSRCGIADHASGAARIRRSNDCGEITHVDFAAKYMTRHRATKRRSNIIEKTRQHEHNGEQHQAAFPIVRQQRRHLIRDGALFKMTR